MFDVRLRLMSDTAEKGRVLPTLQFMVTHVDSATSTVSFTVSEEVSGRLDAPQLVAVEYSTGGAYVQPRNGLFIVSQDDADDADPAGAVRFSGQDYISWMLARTYLHWAEGAVNGERQWTESGFAASAGTIMGGMLGESQARGWGPLITRDFSSSVDSNGEAWTEDEKVLQPWRLLTPLSSVLQTITDQGLCDWWTEHTTLRLFRPGVGETLDNLVFGGNGFSARPTRSSFDDVFTDLTVVPEKADFWLYLNNPGASTRFGRLEATLTQSGVSDHATATTLAQSALIGGRNTKREYAFDWTPINGLPVPWAEFNIGDSITSKTRHGKSLQRVISIQVEKRDGELTVRSTVGDKLIGKAVRQAKRVGGGSIGGGIGGGGQVFPIPDATFSPPLAPTGLHVASNTGRWLPDGTATADVTIQWDAVSQAVDGSGVDIASYELAYRTDVDPIIVTADGLSAGFEWAPPTERLVKVRARAHNGDVSDWSGEISVTPETPASIVPKPVTGLAVVSNVGVFQADGRSVASVTVEWTPVTQSIDDALVDVAEYEVQVGLERFRTTTAQAAFTVPSQASVDVRVKARTTLGVWGDPSPVLPVTGADPATTEAVPTAPDLFSESTNVYGSWDGLLTTGAPGEGFRHVIVETATGESLPESGWERLVAPVAADGGFTIPGTVGETVWVQLRAVDTLGRISGPSVAASVVVVGIDGENVIVDTLDGNRIRAGSLAVDRVTPNFGQYLLIEGNVTIVAMGDDLAEQRLHYDWDENGQRIGDPSSGSDMLLHASGLQVRQNSVPYAWFEDGILRAYQVQADSAQLANHKWEKAGSGRSTLKPI